LEVALQNYGSNSSRNRLTNNKSWVSNFSDWGSYVLGSTKNDSLSDPKGACLKFLTEFEMKYGNIHPDFVEGSYNDALNTAKTSFKFLVIYLHSGLHQDTDAFCRDTLCTELISDFLDENFVSWAGNINTSEAFRISNVLSTTTYPFFAVICNNSIGGLTILDRVQGQISGEDLMARLANVLELHGHILVAAKVENDEREVNRMIRQEQDEAFLQSLAADQEKERKIKEEEERKREEERKQHRIQELKEKKLKNIQSKVPPEPEVSEKDVTQLVIRVTDGSRLQRRFYDSDSLQSVFDYVNAQHPVLLDQDYFLVTNFPRRSFSPDSSLTLAVAGLSPQASLFVQEK